MEDFDSTEPKEKTRWCTYCKHNGDQALCEVCMDAGDNRDRPCWEGEENGG